MAQAIGFTSDIKGDFTVVPIDSLKPHPNNPRKHRLDRIMGSLQAHGQRSPIVVQQSSMTILKGHGTWTAAKQLGWTEVAISLQDMDDDQALAYLLADNRASDGATYDRGMHLKALQQLMSGPGLQGTLFSEDDVEDLSEALKPLATLDAATDAQTIDQFSEGGKAVQAKRESGAQSAQERLKDVRFPLTLADHAVFVDRLKVLQKRYGTAGAIATIIETVKRQAEAEGPAQTGKALDAADKAAAVKGFAEELAAMVWALPGDTIGKAHLMSMLGDVTPAATVEPVPEPVAEVPGQVSIEELMGPEPADSVEVLSERMMQGAQGNRARQQDHWADTVAAQTAKLRAVETPDDVAAELARIRSQARGQERDWSTSSSAPLAAAEVALPASGDTVADLLTAMDSDDEA